MTLRSGLSRALAILLVLAGTLPAWAGEAQTPSTTDAPPSVVRWFGAEGGFEEIACMGIGLGCSGFSSASGLGGALSARSTMAEAIDPDGKVRAWPARTGNRLFMATVPGGTPGFSYLSTIGTTDGPVGAGTVSFAFRTHTPPVQPVVLFRHLGGTPDQTVLLTLTPESSNPADGTTDKDNPLVEEGMRLTFSGGGLVGFSRSLSQGMWHSVTVTYGNGPGSQARLIVDGVQELAGAMSQGGPTGHLDLGIVSPTTTAYSLGIDDIVQSAAVNAAIHGARINYLMPLGGNGAPSWDRRHAVANCASAAQNWQLVSEDQAWNGSCTPGGGALATAEASRVEEFTTEGIPSKHKASESYKRALKVQPSTGTPVLGVRLRMRARTDGAPLSWYLGYVDQGAEVRDTFTFDSGGTGGPVTAWGPTHPVRPNGQAWSASALGGLTLRLDSGLGVAVTREVSGVRLDYVWVP